MNRNTILKYLPWVLILLAGCAVPPATPLPPKELTLATTTSTADSGLLAAILPAFERKFNVKVKVIAVGTGQALKLGEDGNADVVLVHARAQEDAFIQKGFGVNRRDVMYNDFIIVGPVADPAKVFGLAAASDALKAIQTAQAPFVSRGDGSGTHTKEKDLWKAAAAEPKGGWYASVGQGMGETLGFANEKGAYTLADRGTWLALKARLGNLKVLLGGENIAENKDPALLNPYGVILVNPARYSQINADLAEKFAVWLTSSDTQRIIQTFGINEYGQSLFRPSSIELKQAK